MRLALALLVPAVALLITAQAQGSLPLLLLGTAMSGISGALGYRGSLQVVNEIAPADQRAGVSSVYFIVCFMGNSLPVIAVATLTRAFNSLVADSVFAVTLAVAGTRRAGDVRADARSPYSLARGKHPRLIAVRESRSKPRAAHISGLLLLLLAGCAQLPPRRLCPTRLRSRRPTRHRSIS